MAAIVVGGRPQQPQLVTVRRLKPQQGDVFGDGSVLTSDTREPAIEVRMQVTWLSRRQAEMAFPGRAQDVKASAVFRNRDVLHGKSWDPQTDDLVELVGASGKLPLFVMSAEPAYPVLPSLGRPNGGFDGWRVTLTDRRPNASPAGQYE